MKHRRVMLASLSAAMDGSFVAIVDISAAMGAAGATDQNRLIGGVAVMLHVQRLGLDLPLRATGDADFGVPPAILRDRKLVSEIEALGYVRRGGNRWEKRLDDRRVAAVDLLVPAYRSRARDTVRIGDVVTTEVPGLAIAFRHPGVHLEIALLISDANELEATVVLPDAVGMLALKARARTVRSDDRDAEDLWRCLEVAAADGVTPEDFDGDASLRDLRKLLVAEVGTDGRSLPALTLGLRGVAAARRRTRVRALLNEIVGDAGRRA
ncbi:MAG: hypothetical protein ACRDJM_05555 [Actinomycetota bacterium]